MRKWIDYLRDNRSLSEEGLKGVLTSHSLSDVEYLHAQARELSQSIFGREVYVRGLIEITNRCRNNCYYCGIRSSNGEVERYALRDDEILSCCEGGYSLGFRTFVLQGGEDPSMSRERVVGIVRRIRERYPDCAITLSLGEWREEDYQSFFDAGANRYLLRHESHNAEHYARLHPTRMTAESRLRCLEALRRVGFQTGCGFMVGSPYQTIDHIVEDLLFIRDFKPEMVGIGPFIPHHQTPFAEFEAGSVDLTLRILSIVRLMLPHVLLPSTTALATLEVKRGHTIGVLSGANVIMPNLSPPLNRAQYALYDNKASFGGESAEGLAKLAERLNGIGYTISYDRGDYRP